ncbi:MerR family transcriptional regulator [Lacrimispora sp.]|uniref:MerR family transcriptional regulator n=1 Tax=Lacrimispora sp. TaxID=2719234 RepID=UPI002FDAA1B5
MEGKKYSIGEVSKICNISTKALRFYDKIGLIPPDTICEENNYRYYDEKTLLTVPIVKYYKQMGFKLEEMQGLVDGNAYYYVEQSFLSKIDQLRIQEQQIHNSYVSVKEWYELIQEAKMVLENEVNEVSVKYVQPVNYCGMEQDFSYNYMESIVNIEWTNHLESAENEITGAVILRFDSFKEKMEGKCKRAKIIQKPIHPCKDSLSRQEYGGFMAASVYHIGEHETIDEEYEKILDWVEKRGYRCGEESFERYVVDYWTTKNPAKFVTEVIVPIYRE